MNHQWIRSVLMFCVVSTLCASISFAQSTGTIKGQLTDQTTSDPLINANVYIKTLGRGAASDTQGNYTIKNVPYGTYKMRITYIGYATKTISVTVNQATVTVNAALSQSVEQLNNIVVTAVGVQQKARSIGASVQDIPGESISQSHTSSFVSALQGKVAGATVGTSPTLGGSSNITIRGISSITGSNQPLFIIDGVPFEKPDFSSANQNTGRGGYNFSNPIENLNPDNIKSVSVLKSASATALYGSRGANGVIIIQTKSGNNQKGIGISIKQDISLSQVYGLPHYQNKYGGGPGYNSFTLGSTFNASNAAAINDGSLQKEPADQLFANYSDDESWGPRLDGRMVRQWYSFDDINNMNGKETPWIAHPDNVKNFFDTGVNSNTQIGISKGGDNYSYLISLGHKDDKGVTPLAKQRQQEVGFNGHIDLSDDVHAEVSGNYSVNDLSHLSGTGYNDYNVFQQFNQFGQRQVDLGPNSYLADYKYPDGASRNWNWSSIAGAQNRDLIFHDSPYWIRHKEFGNQNTKRFYGKVGLTYDIAPFLSLNGQLKTNYYDDRRNSRIAKNSVAVSSYTQDVRAVQEVNALARLTYKQDLNKSLSLNAFAEGNVRYNNEHHNAEATASGLVSDGIYNIQNSVSRPTVSDYYQQQRVQAILGQVRVGYNDMLFATLSGRNEWSSTLPVDNNSYQYYAATGSFIFTELAGFQNQHILSFGKIRASYGKAANGAPPYSVGTTFPISQPFGNLPLLSVPTTLNNANLKPEQTNEVDIGANLKFLNNRLGVDFTYYYKKTNDEILPITVSRASGYARQYVNAGQVNNNGIEATLNATPIQQGSFSWDLTLNYAKNNNKVVRLARGLKNYTINTAPFTVSVNAQEGEPYGEIRGPGFVYKDGKKVVNPDGTYALSAQKSLGSYQPDWTGAVSTTFHYKGFAATFAFDGQKGGHIFSISNMFGLYAGILEPTARGDVRETGVVTNGVQADGSKNTVVADANGFFHSLFGNGEAFTYDASYIKFQQARLAYTIPVRTFDGTPIQGITVAAYGQNLMTIFKNAPNFDPSTVISGSNFQGVEAGRFPPQRTYGLSVEINF